MMKLKLRAKMDFNQVLIIKIEHFYLVIKLNFVLVNLLLLLLINSFEIKMVPHMMIKRLIFWAICVDYSTAILITNQFSPSPVKFNTW